MNNELDNTTTARIKPPRHVWEPVYIKLEELESIREIKLAKRRERGEFFQSRGW